MNNFTDKEKKILIMLFSVCRKILDVTDVLEIGTEYFDKNDLFDLACKLEIEDDY